MYTENEYYGNMPKSNIVSHSFRGTTWQKGDHKYTQRKKINGKYQYTYSNGNSTLKIESDFDVNNTANNLKNALTGTANMIDSEVNRYKNNKKKEKVKITTKTYDRTPSTSSSNNKKYYEDYPVIKNKKENKEYFDRLEKQRKQEEWEQEASRQKAAYEKRQKINKKLKSPTYRLRNAAKPKIDKVYNKMLNRAKKQDEFVNNIRTAAKERRHKRKMQAYSKKQIR